MADEERRAGAGGATEDAIARLLELSGRRSEPEPARLLRIREAVEPQWRRRTRRRRAVSASAGLALVAVVLAVLVPDVRSRLVGWLGLGSSAADVVASIESVSGNGLRWGGAEEAGVPPGLGSRLRAGQSVSSGESRIAFRLGARTSARLDRDSALRFLGGERLELQRGAVYVDTGRDTGRGAATAARGALEIVTPFGVVEDIGTRFEARLESDALLLRIRDGAVVLHHGRGSYEGRAGEELRLGAEGTVRRRTVTASDPLWEWTLEISAAPDFDGAPLVEILDWAARETGRPLSFADADARRRARRATVRGDVEGLPVLDALAVVLPVSGLRYRFEGESLRIESAAAEAAP